MRKTRMAARILAPLAIAAASAAPGAQAAFPGQPGPIVYSKSSVDEGAAGIEREGGLFAHGPGVKDRPRQLTSTPGDHSPSYSPDGRSIVFAGEAEEEGGSSIFVIRNDGSERREVTGDGLGGSSPYFFPSGRAIAFVRRSEGHDHVFTIRVDGSGLRQLTRGDHDNYDPVVSPDGKRIAFTSDRDPDGRRDRSDIFTMRPDGSRVRVLVDGPRNESEPDYAPSARRIAFVSNRARGLNVFVARADGGGVRPLTVCKPFPVRCRGYSDPAFSPDGRHLAAHWSSTRSSGVSVLRANGGGSLGSFDSGGTEEEGFGTVLGAPTWGPQPR